jgi:hypothetical protein
MAYNMIVEEESHSERNDLFEKDAIQSDAE